MLDLVFYDADQFPSEYKHAFVALKGSWNRFEPTGYKVVHYHHHGEGRSHDAVKAYRACRWEQRL